MQIKNRQQLLMILAGVAVALLVGDSLVFTPLVKLWKSRSAYIVELRKKVNDGDGLVRRDAGIQVRDGTPCGFAPPTRAYRGPEPNPIEENR